MIGQVLVALILVWISYKWYKLKKIEKALKWLPRVPGKPIIGNALDFGTSTEILKVTSGYMEKYDGLCLTDINTEKYILTSDYKFLEFMLSTTKILNKGPDYSYLFDWLGDGLLTAKAARWRKSRKIITPAFHFSILEQFVPVFESNGKIMIELLEKEVDKDSVDVFPYVTMCALDIICETAMGVSINAQNNRQSEYVFAVKEMCRIIIARAFSALKRTSIFYPLYRDFYKERKYVKILHSRTQSVIASRRKEFRSTTNQNPVQNGEGEQIGIKKKMAFLDLLLNSTMDGEPLTDTVIREEVDTFMFEGHDTTTAAICFTLYCLASHPEIQARTVDEQKAIFGKDRHRTTTYRDLQEMKYLETVIKETLRIYPSVPFYSRQTDRDVEYKDGKIIPKGVTIIMLIYAVGRNPKFFPNPEKFDPGRFETMDGSSPYSYLPFSAGPRNCIGQKFAMLELKATVSKVLRNFEVLEASPRHDVILAAEAVLKSMNGVKIKLKKRNWE